MSTRESTPLLDSALFARTAAKTPALTRNEFPFLRPWDVEQNTFCARLWSSPLIINSLTCRNVSHHLQVLIGQHIPADAGNRPDAYAPFPMRQEVQRLASSSGPLQEGTRYFAREALQRLQNQLTIREMCEMAALPPDQVRSTSHTQADLETG